MRDLVYDGLSEAENSDKEEEESSDPSEDERWFAPDM